MVWKYYYDADGKRRIKVKTAGGGPADPTARAASGWSPTTSYYFYEGENLICQQDIGALVPGRVAVRTQVPAAGPQAPPARAVFDPSTLAPQIQEYYDLMPYGRESSTHRRRRRAFSSPANPETKKVTFITSVFVI